MPSNNSRVGIELLSKRSGVTNEHIRAVFESITTLLEEGRSVTISGFGRFEPRFNEPRKINSPVIPAETMVKRRRKVRFVMSETLRKKWILN